MVDGLPRACRFSTIWLVLKKCFFLHKTKHVILSCICCIKWSNACWYLFKKYYCRIGSNMQQLWSANINICWLFSLLVVWITLFGCCVNLFSLRSWTVVLDGANTSLNNKYGKSYGYFKFGSFAWKFLKYRNQGIWVRIPYLKCFMWLFLSGLYA